MTIRNVLFVAVSVLVAQGAQAQQPVSLGNFAGEWVGLQTWTVENPSAQEPQPVTLVLEVENGSLTGSMTPFLGSAQPVAVTKARIEGNRLHVSLDSSRTRSAWQRQVETSLILTREAEELTGHASLKIGDTPWLELDYALSLKRSRY